MIKSAGAKYVILGHSENRIEGDTDNLINNKIKSYWINRGKLKSTMKQQF